MTDKPQKSLPPHKGNVILAPHVVILGAGASRAAIPNGDQNGRIAPLMNDLVDVLKLGSIMDHAGVAYKEQDFETTFDRISKDSSLKSLQDEIEKEVYSYFQQMVLPKEPTVYDYLILSLRGKDIIATFNWDPLLLQAYRRIAISERDAPSLVFLHGNVGVGVCHDDKVTGLRDGVCSKCGQHLQNTPLFYPVLNKDYSKDPFINSEWEKLKRYLSRAYYLTIFGYGAPDSDEAAKAIFTKEWNSNPWRDLAEINIVDIRSKASLLADWRKLIVREHYSTSQSFHDSDLAYNPRRSCDAFFAGHMMCDPWYHRKFPSFRNLLDIQQWVQPLVNEEHQFEQDGTPFLPPEAPRSEQGTDS